ncbi:MAG: DHH family phosphoesterase, partial [Ignavibacteria bacterium]|nr:DHH family phosphoesterase [Ignavibacteria bacterium]
MRQTKKTILDIIKKIDESKTAIILTHTNPDGDAVGSAIALKDYLTFKGITTKIFINSKLPDNLKFLVDNSALTEFDEKIHFQEFQSVDSIFIIDLNNSSRLKSMESALLSSNAYKIIIDHHVEPKLLADLYLIDTESSSTGELIWKVLNADKSYKISEKAANGLYVAIMTDTGCFRFPRTDAEVHRIIA